MFRDRENIKTATLQLKTENSLIKIYRTAQTGIKSPLGLIIDNI